MDTSEQYIKMCDCPEIQEKWEIGIGDFAFHCKDLDVYIVDIDIMVNCNQAHGDTWLPRQDQIQMIMMKDYKNTLEMICDFYAVVTVDKPMGFERMFDASWEQHWIVFYMWKKYTKVWKNERWTNE